MSKCTRLLMTIVIFLFLPTLSIQPQTEVRCDDPIYCTGSLLHQVQMISLFHHSKTFVDLRLINAPDVILQNFDIFMFRNNHKPNEQSIKKFVRENFGEDDSLELWVAPDFPSHPAFLNDIENAEVKKFAQALFEVYRQLGKRVRGRVFEHPEYYSMIAVPYGFIIPGGRFSELTYMDCYWIIKGLLVCDMTTTVRGMIDNFIAMYKRYGLIPKGSRIYYLGRWHPPWLTLIAGLYMEATNDLYWLKKNIAVLDSELRHWLKYKLVMIRKDGIKYNLCRYGSNEKRIRPERYQSDWTFCNVYEDQPKLEECYANQRACVYSGLRLKSNRWIFDDEGGTNANNTFNNPKRVLPVDLNTILCKDFRLMGQFYESINDNKNASFWMEKHYEFLESIRNILYSEKDGIWFDYDILHHQFRKYCWPSNFAPLWAEIYHTDERPALGAKALFYVKRHNMISFRGSVGEPDSDADNLLKMFPPAASLIVQGLYKSQNPRAQEFAAEVAKRWITENYNCKCCRLELFNAESDEVGVDHQKGCAWIIGVALEYVDTFFRNREVPEDFDEYE